MWAEGMEESLVKDLQQAHVLYDRIPPAYPSRWSGKSIRMTCRSSRSPFWSEAPAFALLLRRVALELCTEIKKAPERSRVHRHRRPAPSARGQPRPCQRLKAYNASAYQIMDALAKSNYSLHRRLPTRKPRDSRRPRADCWRASTRWDTSSWAFTTDGCLSEGRGSAPKDGPEERATTSLWFGPRVRARDPRERRRPERGRHHRNTRRKRRQCQRCAH